MNKTISEVIAQTQAVRPDLYTDEQITGWLSELDGQLSVELLKTDPVAYSWPEDAGTELLVPHPYDRLYHLYVIAFFHVVRPVVIHKSYNCTAPHYITQAGE